MAYLAFIFLLLLGCTGGDELVVDASVLDGADEFDPENTTGEVGLVAQTADCGSLGSNSLVGPGNKVLFGFATNDLEVMGLTDGPGGGEDFLSVFFVDFVGADTNHLQSHAFAAGDGLLDVEWVSELVVLWLGGHVLPGDHGGVDFVDNLAESPAVGETVVQVIDVNTVDTEGVDPESEGSLLS